jgi:uncharacterized protein YggE
MAAVRMRMISAIVVAAALSAAPAFAQAPQPQAAPEARIVVGGEGSVTVAPDYALIRGGVVTKAKTAGEAVDANAKLMAAVIAALTNAGVARTDIQTAQFSLQPVYALPQPGSEQKLTGFSASNQLAIKIRQIDKIGDTLDRLVAAGATDVGNVAFQHSDLSKALDQARDAAVADARRKAELYAHAAGLTLGTVAWITESGGYAPPPVFARAIAPSAMAAAPTPIMSGEDTLHVQITVGFDVVH